MLKNKNKNISIPDVAAAIGNYGVNDVGRLCISNSINKWSKHKPVSYPDVGDVGVNEFKSVNYGLTPTISQTGNYEYALDGRWGYNKPTGGDSSPYRLGDFRRYFHYAMPPASINKDITINKADIDSRDIMLQMNISGGDYQIGLSDFNTNVSDALGNRFYGVVLKYKHNTYIKTATKTISNGGILVNLKMSEPPFNVIMTEAVVIHHLLVNKAVPAIQALGNVTVNYLPLPTDLERNVSYMEVEEQTASRLQLSFDLIGRQPRLSGMVDCQQFMGIDAPYFTSSNNLYFKVKLQAHGESGQRFSKAGVKISASPNHFGMSSYYAPLEMYNLSGTPIDYIDVNILSPEYVIMGAANLLNRLGPAEATVTSQSYIHAYIRIFKNVTEVDTHINIKAL